MRVENKNTGVVVDCNAIDDYFGHHRYGYDLGGTKILNEDEFNFEWKRVD